MPWNLIRARLFFLIASSLLQHQPLKFLSYPPNSAINKCFLWIKQLWSVSPLLFTDRILSLWRFLELSHFVRSHTLS